MMFEWGAVVIRNKKDNYKIFLLKWAKGHFALCRPVKIGEGERIRYIFGWAVRSRINFITDCYDPYKLEIRCWNKVFKIKR